MLKNLTKKHKRLLAIVLASVLAITSLAIAMTSTYAAKPPVERDFSTPPNMFPQVAVGATDERNIGGAVSAISHNTQLATTPGGPINNVVRVTGVRAGLAVISVGNLSGIVGNVPYQVFDNRNIVRYTIPRGGEVFFSEPGGTVASPVTVETRITGPGAADANALAFSSIAWTSLQPEVASVDPSDGSITAESKGAAIILGSFTDIWGNTQAMHILVGVEVSLGDPVIDALLRALARGRELLEDAGENPGKYDWDGLEDLRDAIAAGEAALANPDATSSELQKATDDIIEALIELQRRLGRGRLEDAIANGNEILEDAAAGDLNFDEELIKLLEEAIAAGEAVLGDPSSTDDDYREAAIVIEQAILALALGGSSNLIPGPDGGWLRPLGRPRNVYEVLDEDRQSNYPPEFIYNDSDLEDMPNPGRNRPVHARNGSLYVEDPAGSNIWKPIEPDGSLSDDGAIWGGPDREIGTEDDLPAHLGENGLWYADYGQNIWQQIDSNPASAGFGNAIGNKFGGGEDLEPGTEDDLHAPVYIHWDGRFFLAFYDNNGTYYVGDRALNDGGDGLINTSGQGPGNTQYMTPELTDRFWYMDINGNMVHTRTVWDINRVTVEPAVMTLPQGAGYQFSGTAYRGTTVHGPQVFTWEVIGANHPGTIIDNNGTLAISMFETAETLTVRATSAVRNISGTATVTIVPERIWLENATIDRVSTGRSTYLVYDDSSLWGAGANNRGQLGIGDTVNRRAFVPIPDPNTNLKWMAVSNYNAGTNSHTLGLTEDGVLYTWGHNNRGQLGIGNTSGRRTPGLTALGTATRFMAIAAGRDFSAAICVDGRLFTWGHNNEGQLGIGSTSPSTRTTPQQIATNMRFQAVSAGNRCVYAITYEGRDEHGNFLPGRLFAWGLNSSGRLGLGDTARRTLPTQVMVNGSANPIVRAVSGRSEGHVLVLTSNGTLFSAGANGNGQLGDGTTTSRATLTQITTMRFEQIVVGHQHSMALTPDGQLYAWGRNNRGQVGDGTTTNRRAPVWINRGGLTYRAIGAGETTSLGVSTEGRLYLWGRNDFGQFGNGTTINRNFPHLVPLA